MRVDRERVEELKAELRKINKCAIDDLQIFENGKQLKPNPKFLESWKYMGLNNTDYILMETYQENEGPEEAAWVAVE